jgi:uncharacterized protein
VKLTLIKGVATIPAERLADQGPVVEPVGAPVARIRSRADHEGPDIGVWECTPGKWRRQVKSGEFSHFVAGRCVFHADSGEHLAIEAGDAVIFPPNTTGTWEILETVRKVYVIL